jgi:hypothetical protein
MMKMTASVCAATSLMVLVATAVTVVAKITIIKIILMHGNSLSGVSGDEMMAEASQPPENGPAIALDDNYLLLFCGAVVHRQLP